MRTIEILCVGNLKEKYLREAASEYEKRLSPYCKLNIVEINEYKLSDKPSSSDISKCIEYEGQQILSKIPDNSVIITLCIEGNIMSSENFSEKINEYMSDCQSSKICFIIGGSYGLSDSVKSRSNLKLSFSRMTFTHQISRVLLLEQIYRAFQILSGGKYHK